MGRREVLRILVEAIAHRSWEQCSESTFRLLYGLPEDVQLGVASHLVGRYLSVFQRKWPSVRWPGQLLNDLDGWSQRFRRRLPDEPEFEDPADISFKSSFDGLLLAWCFRTRPATLTSSLVYSVTSAIDAHKINAWAVDDPEAVDIWREGRHAPGRLVHQNVAAIAVAEREWTEVMEWLRREEIWTYPEPADSEERDQFLIDWKKHEMLLMVPKEE